MERLLTAAPLVALSLMAAGTARADEGERDSDGVAVTVEIAPVDGEVPGGGGEVPGGGAVPGGLPQTGAEPPSLLLWLAVALVAAGIALVVWRRIRASARLSHASAAAAPYYVVSGRRAEDAADGEVVPTERVESRRERRRGPHHRVR